MQSQKTKLLLALPNGVVLAVVPAKTKHFYNICTTVAQRLRRLSNIVHIFCKCFVLTGIGVREENWCTIWRVTVNVYILAV